MLANYEINDGLLWVYDLLSHLKEEILLSFLFKNPFI